MTSERVVFKYSATACTSLSLRLQRLILFHIPSLAVQLVELVVLGRDKSQRVAVELESHRIVVVFHDIFALVVKYIYNYCNFHFILYLQLYF